MEIASEASKAKLASDTAAEASNQIRKLNQKLLLDQRESQSIIQELNDEHKALLIGLNLKLSESKAEIVQLKSNSRTLDKNRYNDRHDVTTHAREDLLLKINELHQELETSKRQWVGEKRSFASSQAALQQSQAAEFRKALSNHRQELSKLEDEIELRKEIARNLEKDKIALVQKYSEADSFSQRLQKGLEELRSQNSADQPKLISTGGSASREANNVAAISESTIRSLTNKVGISCCNGFGCGYYYSNVIC